MAKSREELYQKYDQAFLNLPVSDEKSYFIHKLIDLKLYILEQEKIDFPFGDPAFDELQDLKGDFKQLKHAVSANDYEDLYDLEQKHCYLFNSDAAKLVLAVTVAAATALAVMIVGAVIGAAVTSWAGPAAALGAFVGAIKGAIWGWQAGIAAGAAVTGLAAGTVVKVGLFSMPQSKMNHAVKAAHSLLEVELVNTSSHINGRAPIIRQGKAYF